MAIVVCYSFIFYLFIHLFNHVFNIDFNGISYSCHLAVTLHIFLLRAVSSSPTPDMDMCAFGSMGRAEITGQKRKKKKKPSKVFLTGQSQNV